MTGTVAPAATSTLSKPRSTSGGSPAAAGKARYNCGTSRPARVPVTIVTGFLGSGKTTLLRHVLTAMHGRRVAVVENEFADEMGIESLILKDGLAGPAADGFYELQNGCLCCTTRDDLVVVLEKLMARSRERRFDDDRRAVHLLEPARRARQPQRRCEPDAIDGDRRRIVADLRSEIEGSIGAGTDAASAGGHAGGHAGRRLPARGQPVNAAH